MFGVTLSLAVIALAVPFITEIFRSKYRAPKLRIKFNFAPPDCHLTTLGKVVPVYYFRFLVENIGKTQAEECEVVLQNILKKQKSGEYKSVNFSTAVNLKWSGINTERSSTTIPVVRTIQPEREVLCDLGRIIHPDYKEETVYWKATPNEKKTNKFMFEIPVEKPYAQWDCLIPGEYKVIVSVYSKNAHREKAEFDIHWSGIWADEEKKMFKELAIALAP